MSKIKINFSPEEAIAEATRSFLTAFLIANGTDAIIAEASGASISGAIKGVSIERKKSLQERIRRCVHDAWIEILPNYDYLPEVCKDVLRENLINSKDCISVLNSNSAASMRSTAFTIIKKYTQFNEATQYTIASSLTYSLLNTVGYELETDDALVLFKEINRILSGQKNDRQQAKEHFMIICEKLNEITTILLDNNSDNIPTDSYHELDFQLDSLEIVQDDDGYIIKDKTLEEILDIIKKEFDNSSIAQVIRQKKYQRLVDNIAEQFKEEIESFNKSRSYNDSFSQNNEESEFTEKDETIKYVSLRPINRGELVDDGTSGFRGLRGKHFTIIDPPFLRTAVYEAIYIVDRDKEFGFYTLERLIETEEAAPGNHTKRTFYLDEICQDGNSLIILSYYKKADYIRVSNAILLGDEVSILNGVECDVFELFPNKGETRGILDKNKFDNSSFKKDQVSDVEEVWVRSAVSNDVQIVFDLESFDPILRKVYLDTKSNEVKAKAKIKRGHKYFIFDFQSSNRSESKSATRKLSNIEKGKYYKEGKLYFQRDLLNAALFFEKDGSPEAIYNIAQLFLENEIYDENLYYEYLIRAAKLEYPQAMFDLANSTLSLDEISLEPMELITKSAEGGLASAQFILGYYYEKGIFYNSDFETSFNWYLQAAKNMFRPANVRIGNRKCRYIFENDKKISLYHDYFCDSALNNDGEAEYCLGGLYLYGLLAKKDEEQGFILLKESFRCGCKDAAYELFRLYNDNQNKFFDKKIALSYLRYISHYDEKYRKELGLWLLNGTGCTQNKENYDEALEILLVFAKKQDVEVLSKLFLYHKDSNNPFSEKESLGYWKRKLCDLEPRIINKYANQLIDGIYYTQDYASAYELLKLLEEGNYAAGINNLGWMYKKGFGCIQDYSYAIRLFERAAMLGSGASYWHLGVIYENGLGTEINIKKALYYYRKAAELGNEKAIRRLSEIV